MRKILHAVAFIILSFLCSAGNFTPGNIVVVRVGTGTGSLSNQSTAVFLDEYSTSGALVQSIPLPTSESGSNHCLTLSGKATSEGALTLSPNGQYLVLVGFDTVPGYASVASGTTNRTIGLIAADGVPNTSTGYYAGSAYVTDNFRSGVTNDGSEFWTGGAGVTTEGGTWYTASGSFTSSPTHVDASDLDTRVINIFDGQLYYTANNSGTPIPGIFQLGSGLPTSSGQTGTLLPGFNGADSVSSPFSFWFFDENPAVPGVDVLYICDDETTSPAGGLYKYSLVGGTWVYNGNIPNSNGLRGITGYKTCSSVNLFLTAGNAVYTFTDTSGYNGQLTGIPNQIIANAPNTVIRGIAFTPGTTAPLPVQVSIGSVTNVTCYGDSNGAVTTTLTGGTSPFAYNWGSGITTQNRNNLKAGTYTVTVTDAGSCTATVSANITQPAIIDFTSTVTGVSCYGGSNGAIFLSTSGGTAPYHFSSNPPEAEFNHLLSGTYSITVIDTNGCSATLSDNISQPSAITITDSVTNLPCQGTSNTGAISVNVSGGTPGYSYLWSNAATTKNISSLPANNYSLTVTDNAECTATISATVSQSGDLTITPAVTPVRCNGQSNGAINISPAGGTPPLNFIWSNHDTTQNISQLPAGSYTITVTDQGGCTLINTININQPAALASTSNITDEKCFGDKEGSISINVTGGTAPYQFNPFDEPANLSAGVYTTTVTDSSGCTLIVNDTITQPDSLSADYSVASVTVYSGDNGKVSTTVSGGTLPYSFDWSNGSIGQVDSGLVAGNYCVTITDHNQCSVSACNDVSQPSSINNPEWLQQFSTWCNGGILHIDFELANQSPGVMMLYDLTGKLMLKVECGIQRQQRLQISTAELSSACYLLNIVTGQGNVTQKIIVTK